jgi:mRNA-degrading endonuclease YafQ of YafQ-DinJ toxin-antitoxin module
MNMNDEELEAYLRKHTLNGQMRELRDACIALGLALVRSTARLLLNILDALGM